MKTLIVGEQPVFCEGLRGLVGQLEGMDDVTVLSAPEAITRVSPEGYDLMLVEIQGANSPERSAVLRNFVASGARVAIFSERDNPSFIRDVMELGVRAFIPKALGIKLVLNALSLVEMGGRYVPDALLAARSEGFAEAPEAFFHNNQEKLTPRQNEVLVELGKGRSNQEIASELGISVATVKLHVNAILQALNVRNRTEAAIIALQNTRAAPAAPVA
ncbi:MAG: response regulator transcription factor [Pseudomonadota bacterium]